MEWLTINENNIKLDVSIVARTSNKFGYGSRKEVFNFDSAISSKEEVVMHLENHSFVEFLELPE